MSKKSWDTDWLVFSKRARRGVLVFLFLFIVFSITPSIYLNYFHEPDLDFKISNFDAADQKLDQQERKAKYTLPNDLFDPNTYTLEEWMSIGLSEKQSQSILNYFEKGGEISYKEDLLKLYVVDDQLYEFLKPKIDLPGKPRISKNEKDVSDDKVVNQTFEKKEVFNGTVEINSASKEDLMKVNGIGEYYAKEIINLREKYGGIHSLQQLKDLFMMTKGKLDTLSQFIIVDEKNIDRINVNTASIERLLSHPLINRDIANSIVFIRQRYGEFKSIDDLKQSPYIDSEKLKILSPYLDVK